MYPVYTADKKSRQKRAPRYGPSGLLGTGARFWMVPPRMPRVARSVGVSCGDPPLEFTRAIRKSLTGPGRRLLDAKVRLQKQVRILIMSSGKPRRKGPLSEKAG